MQLTSMTAERLATIILTETQGLDRLQAQLPLNVVDLGGCWLVKGTPYNDAEAQLDYCQFYVTFRKDSAEIVGLGSEASMRVNDATKRDALRYTTEERFDLAFGARGQDQLDGSDFRINLIFNELLYGGLINSSEGAVDYAYNLIQDSLAFASTSLSALSADEKLGIWHIRRRVNENAPLEQILSFSRLTGHILSGNL